MEMFMLFLIMLWVVGWACYAVVGIAGIGVGVELEALLPFSWVLLALPALYAAYLGIRWLMERHSYSPGDHVVYLMQKYSNHPGPRAEQVYPAPLGEGYHYAVRKLWTVVNVLDGGLVEVVTPGGKRRVVNTTDPHLHKPGPIERLMLELRWHKQFP